MEAAGIQKPVYSHRRNSDATFDSICHCCFSTVATANTEKDLAKHEQQHDCGALAKARTLLHKDGFMSVKRIVPAAIDAA